MSQLTTRLKLVQANQTDLADENVYYNPNIVAIDNELPCSANNIPGSVQYNGQMRSGAAADPNGTPTKQIIQIGNGTSWLSGPQPMALGAVIPSGANDNSGPPGSIVPDTSFVLPQSLAGPYALRFSPYMVWANHLEEFRWRMMIQLVAPRTSPISIIGAIGWSGSWQTSPTNPGSYPPAPPPYGAGGDINGTQHFTTMAFPDQVWAAAGGDNPFPQPGLCLSGRFVAANNQPVQRYLNLAFWLYNNCGSTTGATLKIGDISLISDGGLGCQLLGEMIGDC